MLEAAAVAARGNDAIVAGMLAMLIHRTRARADRLGAIERAAAPSFGTPGRSKAPSWKRSGRTNLPTAGCEHVLRREPSEYRLAGSVLDLRLPGGPDLLGDRFRQRHIVERTGQLVAFGRIRPIEELQDLLRRFGLGLALVHQDERRARNRPGSLARLIGQHQIVAGR